MSKHAADYIKLAAGTLAAGTGLGALGVGPLAGLFGAAGGTMAGGTAAASFAPTATQLGLANLADPAMAAATPMLTQEVAGAASLPSLGAGGAPIGGIPGGAAAMFDPTYAQAQFANTALNPSSGGLLGMSPTTLGDRAAALLNSDRFKLGMRGMNIANSMSQQPPQQQVMSSPPRPAIQQVPVSSIGQPDPRKRDPFSAAGLLGISYG